MKDSYWKMSQRQFMRHPLGVVGLVIIALFCFVGIYAPFFACSKPFVVCYDKQCYFPFFRYLFYRGFYTKPLDLFFNLLMFLLPAAFLLSWIAKRFLRMPALLLGGVIGIGAIVLVSITRDPTIGSNSFKKKQLLTALNWQEEVATLTPYGRLNLLLRYRERKRQHEHLQKDVPFFAAYAKEQKRELAMPTLWQNDEDNYKKEVKRLSSLLGQGSPASQAKAREKLNYIQAKQEWLEKESQQLHFILMPFLSHFHWEEDAGGSQGLNQFLHWWEMTRINRKDLLAGLIFGIRISLVVGFISVGLALLIGIPIGALAGFYGGKTDIVTCRLLEIWEAMPAFFMLLMVIAMTQSKSIFLVIIAIAIFGWTQFSRYIRGEFLKQRHLSYVEACHALGFDDVRIIFRHILPNALPPLLTLLPFAVMGAISSEAGLSFLGLGEEGSCSWGVLMDEGRSAFPAESALLWPAAALLTLLLVSIALVGDALRDALDPKMQGVH